jgi:hypothetical protein
MACLLCEHSRSLSTSLTADLGTTSKRGVWAALFLHGRMHCVYGLGDLHCMGKVFVFNFDIESQLRCLRFETVQIGYVAGSKAVNLAPALKAFCLYDMMKIKNEEAILIATIEKYW